MDGFVWFTKQFDGRIVDATISCTSCKVEWAEGGGAIRSPCCNDGFIEFEKKSQSRRMTQATLRCTSCDSSWSEGYGSIPCPYCDRGHVRFTVFEVSAFQRKLVTRASMRERHRVTRDHTVDPSDVRYTQNTIARRFQCGRTLTQTITQLLSHPDTVFTTIPRIQVFERDGTLWTADNRRLYCFREAKLRSVPVRRINAGAVNPRRFTTRNGGTSIRVR